MAKTETASVATATTAPVIEMTLDEFCTRMSSKKVDGRVALIHGFASKQRRAGVIKSTEAKFKEALAVYAGESPTKYVAAKATK